MNFTERMEAKGLTVVDLCFLSGVGAATIYRARRGIVPGRVHLDAIARELGVTSLTIKKSIELSAETSRA